MTVQIVNADILTYTVDDDFVPVWKCLPTNYTVDSRGLAIMGAGLAKQFACAYPTAWYELGTLTQCNPTTPRVLPLGLKAGCFWWALPTKYRPQDEESSLKLIKDSLWELALYHQRQVVKPIVVMPKLGCGCGKLKWSQVLPIIDMNTRNIDVVVCTRGGE